jgi:hypothetical protein
MAEVLRNKQELKKEAKMASMQQNNLLRHQAMQDYKDQVLQDKELKNRKKSELRKVLDEDFLSKKMHADLLS